MTDQYDTPTPQMLLAAALIEFQHQVPVIAKGRTAKIPTKAGGSYSYRYADLADTWEAVRKPLYDAGLAVTQTLAGGRDGWMTITTKVWHLAGGTDESTVDIETRGRTPQEVGSLITYYKRYTLSAALGISTDEDTDAAGVSAPEPGVAAEVAAEVAAADEARARLLERCEPLGWTEVELTRRMWEQYKKNLRNSRDVVLIDGFADILVEEGPRAKPEPPVQDEKMITDPQLRKLHTLLTREKIVDHDAKLQYCTDALGVEVASTKDLTFAQANKLMNKLDGITPEPTSEPATDA